MDGRKGRFLSVRFYLESGYKTYSWGSGQLIEAIIQEKEMLRDYSKVAHEYPYYVGDYEWN